MTGEKGLRRAVIALDWAKPAGLGKNLPQRGMAGRGSQGFVNRDAAKVAARAVTVRDGTWV